MKDYLFDIGNRLKAKSHQLDASAMLCNKTWRVYSDSSEKELYIFMADGSLIISLNGVVDVGKWLYISANQSLVLTSSSSNVLVHPILVNKLLVLITDGTERCSFLIDSTEKELDYVSNLTLFTNYIDKNLEAYSGHEILLPREENDKRPTFSDLLTQWKDKTKEWIDDTGFTHYIYMNQMQRNGGCGFSGKYYYRGILWPPDDKDWYYAIVAPEVQNVGFIFMARFEQYPTKDGNWRGLSRLEYWKEIHSRDFKVVHLERVYDFDVHYKTFFHKEYFDNPHPDWTCEIFPTEEWNEKHGYHYASKFISIAEWMDLFGHIFWADVDRYNKELTSFLGMNVYAFFESEKWGR